MQTSSQKPLIFERISAVMNEVGAIGKTRKNTQGSGYYFRGIDDVYNALQAPLTKHKVFFAPTVLDKTREERQSKSGGSLLYTILTVKYTFFTEDGSNFEVTTVGEAMDSGDKSSNKAMSAALKYALFQVFCIPTDEDNDTENTTHTVAPRAASQTLSDRRPIGPPPGAAPRATQPAPTRQAPAGRPTTGPTAPRTASPSKKSEPPQQNFADFPNGPITMGE